MTVLDAFAVLVLLVLLASVIAIVILLGSLPGHIARNRHHPHTTAVTIAGWVGLVFVPLWPLALIWAYLDVPAPNGSGANIDELRRRIGALENALQTQRMKEAAE
jgi:hypothetical protein